MKFFVKLSKERTVNLYIGFGVAVFALITSIVYATGFGAQRPEFFNATAIVFSVLGLVAYVVLVLFKPTAKYAGVALWACTFVSLLVYLVAAYMHLAEVFYSGINEETLKLLDGGFVACIIMYLIAAIASNVVMWLKMVTVDENSGEKA